MNILPQSLHAATLGHLARRLFEAESSLTSLTGGGVDAILDASGSPYLLRAAQERFRENESRLQALLDSVPDPIIATDDSGKILFQNAAVSRVLGYDVQELLDRNLFEFVHASDVRQLYHAYFGIIERFRESADADFRFIASDQTWRLCEATLSRVMERAPFEGLMLTLREAGLRRKNQEDAVRHNSACETARFLTHLCKELRKPLAPALMGVRQLLSDNPSLELRPALDIILQQLERQSQLLEELLVFSQAQDRAVSDEVRAEAFIG